MRPCFTREFEGKIRSIYLSPSTGLLFIAEEAQGAARPKLHIARIVSGTEGPILSEVSSIETDRLVAEVVQSDDGELVAVRHSGKERTIRIFEASDGGLKQCGIVQPDLSWGQIQKITFIPESHDLCLIHKIIDKQAGDGNGLSILRIGNREISCLHSQRLRVNAPGTMVAFNGNTMFICNRSSLTAIDLSSR
jgi:hypothetical protein